MSMLDAGLQSHPRDGGTGWDRAQDPEGAGWLIFAGIMLAVAGTLNGIYGIAAIGDSTFFVDGAAYILSGLNTWGWIMLVLGILQLAAAGSIWNGGSFGVWFGIAVASVNAVGALLSIPAYPFWSVAIFAVDILVISALTAYGGRRRPV